MLTLRRSVLPVLAVLLGAVPSLSSPAMWEVRDQDSALWLFGSMQTLPEDTQWRTDLFDQLATDADQIVFEVDMTSDEQAKGAAEMFVQGTNTDGTLLTDLIDESTEVALRAATAGGPRSFGQILAMRPWYAAYVIAYDAEAARGRGEGVEFQLLPALTPQRMGHLSSMAELLDAFVGGPQEEQIAQLRLTLDALPDLDKILQKELSYWLAGRQEQLSAMLVWRDAHYPFDHLMGAMRTLNRDWTGKLSLLLADDVEALVVVSGDHMIGEDNLLDLLAEQGFSVRRVQ
jgi:uncharacterized protein